MKTRNPTITLAALALLSLLIPSVGCSDRGEETGPQPVELRTHNVPEGHDADQIRNYIRGSLEQGDTVYGTVRTYPDGSLVVTAPPSIQRGVEDLLAALAKRPPAPAAIGPSSASIRYWALLGRQTRSGQGVSFASDSLSRETELLPVLEAIAGSQGAQEFALVERLRLSSSVNAPPASIRGRHISANQRLSSDATGLLADIELQILTHQGHPTQSLNTRVRLEPDRYVVLGQAAYNPKSERLPAGWDVDEVYLYYVISASID